MLQPPPLLVSRVQRSLEVSRFGTALRVAVVRTQLVRCRRQWPKGLPRTLPAPLAAPKLGRTALTAATVSWGCRVLLTSSPLWVPGGFRSSAHWTAPPAPGPNRFPGRPAVAAPLTPPGGARGIVALVVLVHEGLPGAGQR